MSLHLSAETGAVPVPSTGARAESFAEESRPLRGGETWAQLSEEKYRSPIYADALRQYNKQHWQASARMQHDGELVAGETVYLPDLAKLERAHGSLIRRPGPAGNP
jgi:hypothetical protein